MLLATLGREQVNEGLSTLLVSDTPLSLTEGGQLRQRYTATESL